MLPDMVRRHHASRSNGRNWFAAYVLLVLACLLPMAQAQSSNLVAAPVDPGNRVTLKGHHPAWASAQNDTGAVPPDLALERLTIVLNRTPQQEQAFTQFLADQQNPKSPNYHHWLTPVEIGKRFGVSTHDIDAVTGWLQTQGLTVDEVSNSRVFITFSGPAVNVANAFGGEMHYFQVGSEKRISLTTQPKIPAALSGVILSVSGLATVKFHPQHHAKLATIQLPDATQGAVPLLTLSATDHAIAPADFATIYNLTTGFNGAGQTIAIVGRSRVCPADITNFATLAGVTINGPTVIVPPLGIDPGAASCATNASGDQGEATLDVTRSGSIAQGAHIDLVISADSQSPMVDGIMTSAKYVIDTNPVPAHVMSISFGLCEAAAPGEATTYDKLFQQAAGEGISVMVSSGDSGAAGCDDSFTTPPSPPSFQAPNLICSSGYGTCVGGTEFNDTANQSQYWSGTNSSTLGSALSYIPEGAWNEPGATNATVVAGTGGGVSLVIATPTWQTGTGVPSARAGRYTPDVSFSAAGHDAYFACLAGGGGSCVVSGGTFNFVEFSGTSASAPDMAGVAAILNQSQGAAQGNLNPTLYGLAGHTSFAVFHDVTVATSGVTSCTVATPSMCNNSVAGATTLTGGTAGFLVTAGYDEATGLGSINIANLLAHWTPVAPTTTTLMSSAAQIPIGGSVTFTATVAPTAGSGTPTGTVTFLDGTTTIGTGTLTAGVATFTTTTLASGLRSITATYAGDNTFAGSTSAVFTETVGTLTQTTLMSSSPSAQFGTNVTFTATVAPQSGTGTPTGNMAFMDGVVLLGSGTLTAGVATFSTSTLTAGSHSITGVYGGDSTFAGSTSAVLTQTIVGLPTLTGLQTSAPQVGVATSVTFTATVALTSGTGTPTGNVAFFDGSASLGTSSLNAGTAVLSTSALPEGTHSITATYQGDTTYGQSTSPVVSQSVVTIHAAVSVNSVTVSPGGNQSLSFVITPTAGFSPTVTVTCTGAPAESTCTAGTSSTSNGVQTFPISITTTAPHSNRQQLPMGMYVPAGLLLPLGALFLAAGGRRRTRRHLGWLGLTLLLTLSTLWLSACGGSSGTKDPGTPVGTYNLTVTAATSGTISITVPKSVTLNVQ